MKMLRTIVVALPALITTCFAASTSRNVQVILGETRNKIALRPVVYEDLDDVVTTFVDAFSPGPFSQYTQIHEPDLRNYTWRCYRQLFEKEWNAFAANDKAFGNVISVPRRHDSTGNVTKERVVSIAIWHWLEPEQDQATALQVQSFQPFMSNHKGKCSDHLDTNVTRAAQVEDFMQEFENKFYSNLTETQLYLNLLATHPDWDGHGFGAAQVEFGLAKAADAGFNVTLVATPAGYPLYASLGFDAVANLTMEMFDGLGTLWSEYMKWDLESQGA